MGTFMTVATLVSAWRVIRVKRQKRTGNEINSRATFSTKFDPLESFFFFARVEIGRAQGQLYTEAIGCLRSQLEVSSALSLGGNTG